MVKKRNAERVGTVPPKPADPVKSFETTDRPVKPKSKDEPKLLSGAKEKAVTDLIRQTDAITNNVPVTGLPPRVVLGNYTEKVMTNLREVLKVSHF